jgi:N utilization substance protein B
MPSRRQIREAAIQFLYSSDLEDGGEPTAMRDAFWQFVTESDRRALALATWRTIHHLNLGREQRRDEFLGRLPAALATLKADPGLEPEAACLQRVADLENEWDKAIGNLSRLPREGEDGVVSARFEPAFERLFLINRELANSRNEFTRVLADNPGLKARLEPIAGTITRLERISERLRMLEHPERFPDQSEFARIRESRENIRMLREKTDSLVDRVLARRDEIDTALTSVIDNYVPERVDPIDRAILRLGTYEVRFDDDVPVPVAINEAIELAREFGTTDSPRFVNGILDRIAKS